MSEENKVEQTEEQEQVTQPEVTEEKPKERMFTEAEMQEIVTNRVARDRSALNKRLGVKDFDEAVLAVKQQKELAEKQKIQKGEFEEILKNKTQEFNREKEELQNQLRDIKINKALLSSASKGRAINPDQVVSLLQNQIKLNESGNVEILDSKGLPRYNNNGELFTTDELVQEFLTQNPHFVSPTPSGSGTRSNVDRQELKKAFNYEDYDFSIKEHRDLYREYKKKRDSKPRVINSLK